MQTINNYLDGNDIKDVQTEDQQPYHSVTIGRDDKRYDTSLHGYLDKNHGDETGRFNSIDDLYEGMLDGIASIPWEPPRSFAYGLLFGLDHAGAITEDAFWQGRHESLGEESRTNYSLGGKAVARGRAEQGDYDSFTENLKDTAFQSGAAGIVTGVTASWGGALLSGLELAGAYQTFLADNPELADVLTASPAVEELTTTCVSGAVLALSYTGTYLASLDYLNYRQRNTAEGEHTGERDG